MAIFTVSRRGGEFPKLDLSSLQNLNIVDACIGNMRVCAVHAMPAIVCGEKFRVGNMHSGKTNFIIAPSCYILPLFVFSSCSKGKVADDVNQENMSGQRDKSNAHFVHP